MMKKLMVALLVFSLITCATGCAIKHKSNNDTHYDAVIDDENNQNKNESIVNTKKKINNEIEFGTDYTNGLAFVKVKGDEKNYCIDKNGNIVFETSAIIFKMDDPAHAYSAITTGFYNNITLISDLFQMNYITICDKTGKLTTAEELGVTYFLDDAFKDGFIITVTKGQKSKDDKIGILNHNLEWVIEPSSSIVKSLGMEYGVNISTRFYHDYILYGVSGSVDIRTGELSHESYRTKGKHIQASLVRYWSAKPDGYYNSDGQLVVDIGNNSELMSIGFATVDIDGAEFVNGKAPIVFSNNTDFIRFSAIDTDGNMDFEPVDFGENIDYIKIDGNYILVVGNQKNYNTTARIYDLSGKLISELEPTVILIGSNFNLQNEVVRVSFGIVPIDNNGNVIGDAVRWVKYFGTNLQPLF